MATWRIENLDRQLTGEAVGGVTVAHWRVVKEETVGTGEDTVTHSVNAYGAVNLTPDPASEGYIEFANLTESDVIGWVKSRVDVAAIEARLASKIEEQKTPSTATGVPW